MRSKLFKESPKRVNISSGRWVQIMPDESDGYALFDALTGNAIGRILIDAGDNWIYDGNILNVYEQEDVAAFVTGNQKEMNELIKKL